jgi:hypothetical protein
VQVRAHADLEQHEDRVGRGQGEHRPPQAGQIFRRADQRAPEQERHPDDEQVADGERGEVAHRHALPVREPVEPLLVLEHGGDDGEQQEAKDEVEAAAGSRAAEQGRGEDHTGQQRRQPGDLVLAERRHERGIERHALGQEQHAAEEHEERGALHAEDPAGGQRQGDAQA